MRLNRVGPSKTTSSSNGTRQTYLLPTKRICWMKHRSQSAATPRTLVKSAIEGSRIAWQLRWMTLRSTQEEGSTAESEEPRLLNLKSHNHCKGKLSRFHVQVSTKSRLVFISDLAANACFRRFAMNFVRKQVLQDRKIWWRRL